MRLPPRPPIPAPHPYPQPFPADEGEEEGDEGPFGSPPALSSGPREIGSSRPIF